VGWVCRQLPLRNAAQSYETCNYEVLGLQTAVEHEEVRMGNWQIRAHSDPMISATNARGFDRLIWPKTKHFSKESLASKKLHRVWKAKGIASRFCRICRQSGREKNGRKCENNWAKKRNDPSAFLRADFIDSEHGNRRSARLFHD
jgi:hypothetical protein